MNAAPTRKPVVTADIFESVLTLNFLNGEELSVDITKLDPAIVKQATLHGLKQKLVDAAAIARNPDNGASATPQDKYNAVKTVYDRLTSATPSWNAVREGVERVPGGVFVRAIAELTGKSLTDTQTNIKAMTKEQQSALKKNMKVVEIMQRMEREEAAKSESSGDDLLAMLSASDSPVVDGNSGDDVEAPIDTAPTKARKAKKAD